MLNNWLTHPTLVNLKVFKIEARESRFHNKIPAIHLTVARVIGNPF